MRPGMWVIVVTFDNGEVGCNEGYNTLQECLNSIKNKVNKDNVEVIDNFTLLDKENNIEYEAKYITNYSEGV